MNKISRCWIFLGVVVIGILTLLVLSGCKPETARSPLATPELIVTQIPAFTSPRPTPLPVTPWPTATPLPDRGVRTSMAVEVHPVMEQSRQRFASLALDGQTLVASIDDDKGKTLPIIIDLETRQAQVLDQNPNQAWINDLHISKQYAAWIASQNNQDTLYVRDMRIGQTSSIADDTHNVDFSGTTMVWNQIGGDSWDIWGYDVEQHRRFPVVTGPGAQFEPLISKRWVIYMNLLPGSMSNTSNVPDAPHSLNVVNIDSGQVITIGTVSWDSHRYTPGLYAIDAPWVAWSTGELSKTPDLHFYNLDTRASYTVTVPSCGAFVPDRPSLIGSPGYLELSGNIVIFKGCYQDLGYDIERKVFFSLPTNAPHGSSWAGWSISGDWLVWVLLSGPNGQEESHIYTARIIRDK